jgi:hypothetical protein
MTALWIVFALLVGACFGGVGTAAWYERRAGDDGLLPERTDREPFTGHVPVSPWAAPKDDGEDQP